MRQMRLLITGPSYIDDYRAYYEYSKWCAGNWELVSGIRELVTGGNPTGPDQVPYMVLTSPRTAPIYCVTPFDVLEGETSYSRDVTMTEYADLLLLIWDGECDYSASILHYMEELGKPTYQVIVR